MYLSGIQSGAVPPGTTLIDDISVFVAVAQYASFTRAAEALGSSKSNVGKAVQRIEARLGTRLFQRTTRTVRLTEDGETYLEAARSALDELREAEATVLARRAEPAGRVRLDVPIGFGRLLLPSFAALRRTYPRVSVELSLSDHTKNAIADGWDIVVRIGELLAGAEMTARKLCTLKLALYASPDYIRRKRAPTSVTDLITREAIVFRAANGRLRRWTVTENGSISEVAPEATLIVNDGRAVVDAAISGFGIAQIFERVAASHVDSGELVHVLPQADAPGPAVHALIPAGRGMAAKTRVVLEHLVKQLGS